MRTRDPEACHEREREPGLFHQARCETVVRPTHIEGISPLGKKMTAGWTHTIRYIL